MYSVKKINDYYHVKYDGYCDKDIEHFHSFITHYRKSITFHDKGYLMYEDILKELTKWQCEMKLTPYDYQQEAIDFVMEKKSALIRACCGSGR